MLLAIAFTASTISMSNLMPLLLQVATSGLTILDGLLMIGYLSITALCLAVLARAMYRVDKKAGRIRNRVRWFE
jgi:hypothetical protein